jgi:CHAD domain-containing protein
LNGSQTTFRAAPGFDHAELAERLPGRYRVTARTSRPLRAVYYDTFDGRLRRKGGTLCAARTNGSRLLSWSRRDPDRGHDLPWAGPIGFASELPPGVLRDELGPLIEMRRLLGQVEVERRSTTLDIIDRRDKCVARVRIDRVRARRAEGAHGWSEAPTLLTVLPVRGFRRQLANVLRTAREVDALERYTGGELGAALESLGGVLRTPLPRRPVEIGHEERADVALARILAAELDVMRANESGLRADIDSEFLHDFRVAVRRTRSLLGQVRRVFPDDVVERFQEEFRWLGRVTGPVRDLDVLLLELDEPWAGVDEAELEPLRELVAREQAEAHAELIAQLDTPRWPRLVRSWERFLSAPPPGSARTSHGGRPIGRVLAKRIRKLHRRLLERGGAIEPGTPVEELHALRIEAKKLRYLLEAARPLAKAKHMEDSVRALKRLQTILGDLNDTDVQQETFARHAKLLDAAPAFALGRMAELVRARGSEARAAFEPRFAEFSRPKVLRRFDQVLEEVAG